MTHTFNTNCPICGESAELTVSTSAYLDWQMGALIQDAFHMLSADEREQIMTGICPSCWIMGFGEE